MSSGRSGRKRDLPNTPNTSAVVGNTAVQRRTPWRSLRWANEHGGSLTSTLVFQTPNDELLLRAAETLWDNVSYRLKRLATPPINTEQLLSVLPQARDPPQEFAVYRRLEVFDHLARAGVYIKRHPQLRALYPQLDEYRTQIADILSAMAARITRGGEIAPPSNRVDAWVYFLRASGNVER